MPAWLVIALIVVGAVALVVVAVMGLSFVMVRRADEDPALSGANASTVANCLGVEGLGRSLVGTGTLAVFDDEVRFVIAAPRQEVRIARRRLTVTLERPRDARRSSSADDASLRLAWTEDGRRCSAEFRVPDPATWRNLLLR